MVFYFECCDSQYVIYMGKDKYENEELIKYGFPEDVCFLSVNYAVLCGRSGSMLMICQVPMCTSAVPQVSQSMK